MTAIRSRFTRLLIAILSLVIAAAVWLPSLHLIFRPRLADYRQENAIAPRARELANRHLHLWEDPDAREKEISAMRASNAEWDFMGRTFFVLSLANMALDEPQQARRYLDVIDAIIAQTLALEHEKGMYFFLMDYAKSREFRAKTARSEFLDGEIAFMLGARLMVERKAEYEPLLAERVEALVRGMSRGPVMCGESYPDECWMFCNAVGAAAVRMSDRLDRRDHSEFLRAWVAKIRGRLVDEQTGILISSFTYDGQVIDGPEGSSIWTVAHFLKMVDPDFAADQYRRARKEIGRQILGFGFAREWPASWDGPMDVDSGPIVPIVGASAGSSGQAVLGAASFGDDRWLRELVTTLQFAAFPVRSNGRLNYAASNQVGDAVLLYAMTCGPLEKRVMEGLP